MKKTILVMTTLVLTCVALLIGCEVNGGNEDEPSNTGINPSSITADFQTFYIKVLDQNRTSAPDISTGARWHFHNNVNNGDTIGFAIQKVFVNDSPSETGAVVLYDFTNAPDFSSANKGAFDAGNMGAGSVSGGAWVVERTDSGYTYLGNLASGAEAGGKAYWGFVVKNVSTTAKADNINLEIVNADAVSVANSSLAGWFGIKDFGAYADPGEPNDPDDPDPVEPVLTSEFAVYYLNIADAGLAGIEGIHFHNKTDHELGMVVDRIFATNTPGVEEAVVFEFDGTDKSTEEDAANGGYYWSNINGADGSVTIGAAAGADNYAYIGGFATPLFTDKAYIGIVAKNVSDTVKGDEITVQPIIGGETDDSKSKTFAELFCE
ncbi:MAG: hypothetical protein LBL06_00685 [Treponema sp.]|jgi:hypothetical protein|nr:hypothetical protein [Treponema sp.]